MGEVDAVQEDVFIGPAAGFPEGVGGVAVESGEVGVGDTEGCQADIVGVDF